MEELLDRPTELSFTVFRGSAAVAEGLLTTDQLRTNDWRRVRRDIYVDSRVLLDHGVDCHAAALVLPGRACFSHMSAAWLHGVDLAADYGDPVHVTVPPPAKPGGWSAIKVHQTTIDPGDVDVLDGLMLTSPRRTAWDLAASLPLDQAIPTLDGLLARALVTPDELHAYAESRAGVRGYRKAEHAFELADGRSRDADASRLRLAILQQGLPRPIPHYTVEGPRGALLQPELGWPRFRVALVFSRPGDGGEGYEEADWRVLRVHRYRVDREQPAVLRELRAVLLARGWCP
ncbi:hypothetical protein AB0M47_34730 [Hamadaea sp. NPDC051192]|uniref:type IV toxin-antitoxin system AbiEi family antitoxin n=1 Tax=Hamadaea sp. NPDC051192 TaxID=3154940 RepID=UPI00341D4D84